MGLVKSLYLEELERWTTPNQPYDPRPPVPAATRAAVLERAEGGCEICRIDYPLELHHRHYNSQGEEEPEDLYALCRGCHHAMHTDPLGQFWIDPIEMQVTWGIGEGEMDIDDIPGWRG